MSATPPPPPPQQPYGGSAPQLSPADEKLWATLVQVGGILFSWIPALIGYLVLKDRGPFVRAHTATALNFQITILIAYVVGRHPVDRRRRHLHRHRRVGARHRVQHHRSGEGQPGRVLHVPDRDPLRQLSDDRAVADPLGGFVRQ